MNSGLTQVQPWIVDAHIHVWDLSRNRYPWLQRDDDGSSFLGDFSSLRHNYMIDDYLAATKNQDVRMAVHVEANHDPDDPVKETAWLDEVAGASGFPMTIVGFARLQDRNVAQVLDSHMRSKRFRGVRQALNWGEARTAGGELMNNPHWRAGFALLQPAGLSFDMQIFPSQMTDAAQLAGDFPDTLIVLNHTGMPPDRGPEAFEIWRQGMRALAGHDNVVVKISGFAQMDAAWNDSNIRPYVLGTLETFGPKRTMFASNYPVDHLRGTFDEIFDAYRGLTADLSPNEQSDLFHGTAIRTYRMSDLESSSKAKAV